MPIKLILNTKRREFTTNIFERVTVTGDVQMNPVLKREAESLLMSSAVSATDQQYPQPSEPRVKR